MNQRIEKLRNQSLEAVNRITSERGMLVTEFYKNGNASASSIPVQRAKAFEYILTHKKIFINEGELIVGERGPEPKATPTYPEINLHTLEDLDILDSREKVSFKVDEQTRKDYEQVIIPYWKGRTQRERIFRHLPPEWKNAYEAGVFTEFQEQRAPGHTVAGKQVFEKGMLDWIEEIHAALSNLDYMNDPEAPQKRDELEAMEIVARAMIHYAERHSDKLREMAEKTQDTQRKGELEKMAAICRRVPAHAPQTLHEALQHYWFIHLGVITELNPWDSFNPERLDQHLNPLFQKEQKAGSINREQAVELLESFWVKFNNHPSPPKVGVTAQESNTYTDFCLINLGGVKEDGSDAVNELSFLLLDVIEEMRLLQPSSMIQVSRENPDAFIERAAMIIKTGFGQPSVFNTDEIIEELTRQGKSVEDARTGGASGCVESGAFGKEAYILTGYFNLPKVLEITLHNGIDPRTGKQIGQATGTAEELNTMEKLREAFSVQLQHFIDIKIRGNHVIDAIFAHHLPVPFLSLVIDDCIKNATDYHAGGARYNSSYIQGVGLGSVTDMLTALKFHVYDRETLSLDTFLDILKQDFGGHEEIRSELLYKTPKYGNDDDYADSEATRVFELFFGAVDGRPTFRGGAFRINLLPTTSHVYFGSVMIASSDGRHAGQPLSEGISPVQGMDRKGPTAVLNSAAKIDHSLTGGTLLNQKFSPDFFADQQGIWKLARLIRGYFLMGGHHIQFNVVSAETLREAQRHPENYQDLIVRVAGYSDYFNDLGEDLQNEIIRRTAHGEG